LGKRLCTRFPGDALRQNGPALAVDEPDDRRLDRAARPAKLDPRFDDEERFPAADRLDRDAPVPSRCDRRRFWFCRVAQKQKKQY
jgi:hypothetical protein